MDRKIDLRLKPYGFTMMELLIFLAIFSILAGLAIREVLSYLEIARLRAGLNQFLADLNYIKNQAQITGLAWGIRACTNSREYKIFIDANGDCMDTQPNCNASTLKVCLNNPSQNCENDSDCSHYFNGTCKPLEIQKSLDDNLIFTKENSTNHFYVIFDRKGLPFDYTCGIGANNVTIQLPSGQATSTIYIDKVGRIRVQ